MANRKSFLHRLFAFMVLIPSGMVFLLYLYLGSFARMIADDFCSVYFARRLGLLRSIWYWYKNWHGGYADAVADWLLEKISIYSVPVIIPLALLFWLVFMFIVIHWQLRHIPHPGQSNTTALSLGMVFLFVVLLLSPNIPQSLYWWNGMRAYTLPLILLTLYIALLQIGVEKLKTIRQIALVHVAGFLLAFLLGGLGEAYVAFQVVVFVFFLMLEWIVSRDANTPRFRLLLNGLIGSILSLVVVVAAPGNTVRQEYFPPPPSVMRLLQISMESYLDFILDIVRSPEKITGLLGAVLTAAYFGARHERNSAINRWLIPLLALGAFGISFSCFVPAAYGTSEATPTRTVIIPVFALVACLLWAGFLSGQQLPESGKGSRLFASAIPIIAVILVGYSAVLNWQALYNVRTDYIEFAQKWDEADALILNAKAGNLNVVQIPALDNLAGLERPTDNKRYWVNKCYSAYYGIQVYGPPYGP